MNVVQGSDMVLYYHRDSDDTDVAFAAAKNCTLSLNPTFRDVTDYASAFFRKQRPDITAWDIKGDGMVTLDGFSYLNLSNLIIDRTPILVKFVIDNGPDGLVIYAGNVYIGPTSITGNFNEAGTYSFTLEGTGAFNTTGTTVTPSGILVEGGTVTRFEYTVVSAGTIITIGSTIGANVITELARGSANISKIIYSGSPTGSQIKFNTDGTFEAPADQPWIAGEEISGNFK